MNQNERVYFKVPFSEKDLAKKNGAKWDGKRRKWWFPEDALTDFIKDKWELVPQKPKNVSVSMPTAPDGSRVIRGWFDGGSRGNPGIWGYGSLLRHGNGKMIGIRMGGGKNGTNNDAEYQGIVSLLEMLREETARSPPDPRVHIILYGDSKLVINQLNREWECKSDTLRPLYMRSLEILDELRGKSAEYGIESILLEHIYRDKNAEADNLANIVMDRI